MPGTWIRGFWGAWASQMVTLNPPSLVADGVAANKLAVKMLTGEIGLS